MTLSLKSCSLLAIIAIGLATAQPAFADLVINEVRIDQSGTDNDEYFELYADGVSIGDLSDYWYITIGDTSSGGGDQFGVVENVTNLFGALNAGDFLLVGESTMTIGTPDIVTTLVFENSDNVTHLLVTGFTGAAFDDLDTDNDGTLDSTPWSSVVDGFALLESVGSGDGVYADDLGLPSIGPDGSFVPAHAFRDVDGSAGNWTIGSFSDLTGDTPGFSNNAIPEPTVLALFGMTGLAICFGIRRRA